MLLSGREGSPTASKMVEAPKQRYLHGTESKS